MTEHDDDKTEATPDAGEKLSLDKLEKLTPKEFGDLAVKFASDTAYAAAGFANLVAEKAKEFAEKQRAAMAEANPEAAEQSKAFLDQFTAQVNKFVDELGHTYKDLAERGREAVAKIQHQGEAKPASKDTPGMFDIVDDAETAEPSSTVAGEAVDDVAETFAEKVDDAAEKIEDVREETSGE